MAGKKVYPGDVTAVWVDRAVASDAVNKKGSFREVRTLASLHPRSGFAKFVLARNVYALSDAVRELIPTLPQKDAEKLQKLLDKVSTPHAEADEPGDERAQSASPSDTPEKDQRG